MNALRQAWLNLLAAVQFLTRIPVPLIPYAEDTLARSVKFFPLVGLLIGALAALLNLLIAPHLPRLITAVILVIFLVTITGCFHEDGLADAADGMHLLIFGEWGAHENFAYAGNRLLSASEAKAFG